MEKREINIVVDLEKNTVTTIYINCGNQIYCAKIAYNALRKYLIENDAL